MLLGFQHKKYLVNKVSEVKSDTSDIPKRSVNEINDRE